MYSYRLLPFLGLLVLASLVAMVAGVGDVSERTTDSPAAISAGDHASDGAALRAGRRDP